MNLPMCGHFYKWQMVVMPQIKYLSSNWLSGSNMASLFTEDLHLCCLPINTVKTPCRGMTEEHQYRKDCRLTLRACKPCTNLLGQMMSFIMSLKKSCRAWEHRRKVSWRKTKQTKQPKQAFAGFNVAYRNFLLGTFLIQYWRQFWVYTSLKCIQS